MIKKKLVFYCIIIHLLFTPCRDFAESIAYRVIHAAVMTGAITACSYPLCLGKSFLTSYCISSLPCEKNVHKLLLNSLGEAATSGLVTMGMIYLTEFGQGKGMIEGVNSIPSQKLRAFEIVLGIMITTISVKGAENYLAAPHSG